MNAKFLLSVFVRGVCMGIADLIPGVSGGTIAFISGIYQRLLAALSVFSQPPFWRALLKFEVRLVWQITDATFLVALFAGILSAVALFSSLLHGWLESHPHFVLGFFSGLVLASIVAVSRRVPALAARHAAYGAVAAVVTFFLVELDAITLQDANKAALFVGGMIAICAMLLPGISGSYLLLIFGLYPAVITAVHERDFLTLIVFAAGCGIGLLMFARLLTALLQRHYSTTMAVLIGVMVGALPKIWPWKEAAEGVKVILQPNVMPAAAAAADVGWVVALAVAGGASVLLIDHLARRMESAAK